MSADSFVARSVGLSPASPTRSLAATCSCAARGGARGGVPGGGKRASAAACACAALPGAVAAAGALLLPSRCACACAGSCVCAAAGLAETAARDGADAAPQLGVIAQEVHAAAARGAGSAASAAPAPAARGDAQPCPPRVDDARGAAAARESACARAPDGGVCADGGVGPALPSAAGAGSASTAHSDVLLRAVASGERRGGAERTHVGGVPAASNAPATSDGASAHGRSVVAAASAATSALPVATAAVAAGRRGRGGWRCAPALVESASALRQSDAAALFAAHDAVRAVAVCMSCAQCPQNCTQSLRVQSHLAVQMAEQEFLRRARCREKTAQRRFRLRGLLAPASSGADMPASSSTPVRRAANMSAAGKLAVAITHCAAAAPK